MGVLDLDIFLVEIQAYNPNTASTVTLRFGTFGFVTTPADTPASTVYEARLRQPNAIRRTMFADRSTRGRSTVGLGDIVLNNADGALDAYKDYGFDGRTLTVKWAAAQNTAFASFTTVSVVTMQGWEFNDRDVFVKLRDRQAAVSIPLQSTKFAGSGLGALEGSSDLIGKPKPVCYGSAYNVTPPCVETAKLIYQAADKQMASVPAVYDRGVSLQQMYGRYLINVGPSGDVWKSTDSGDNWSTLGSTGVSNALGIAYGGGAWCIGDGSGTVVRSIDGGATWTVVLSSASSIRGMRYVNSTFVALSRDRIYYSTDYGATWTQVIVNNTTSARDYRGIAFGVDRWVMCASTTDIYYSLDLKNWTTVAVGITCNDIAYSTALALFVVVGGAGTPAIQTSPDAIGWTSRTVPASHTAYRYERVTCSTARVVAVGRSAAGGTDSIIASSSDAITWTARTNPTAGLTLLGVCHDGSYFIGCGTDTSTGTHKKVRSSDGDTWVAATASGAGGGGTGDDVGAGYGGATATYATTADLLDNAQQPPAGTYKVFLGSAGTYFRLGASPSGLVTCDVTEGATAADRTTAQVYKRLLTERAALTGSDYSAGDLTTLDAATNGTAVVGFWTDQETLISTALDQLVASLWASWFTDRTGVFRIKQLLRPTGTASVTFLSTDLLRPLLKLASNDPGGGIPTFSTVVRHTVNNTVQDADVATSVTDSRKTFLRKPWREASAVDTNVVTVHALAVQIVDETMLTDATVALAEANRRQGIRSEPHDIFEIVVPWTAANAAIDISDLVGIVHTRFGMNVTGDTTAGFIGRVIGVAPNGRDRTITQTLWGQSVANLVTNTGDYLVTDTGAYLVTA